MRLFLTLLLLSVYPISSQAVTTDDLASFPAAELISGVQSACQNSNEKQLFGLHSKKIQAQLQAFPDHSRLVSFYCTQIKELIHRLGGSPQNASYYVRQNPDTPSKSELCMAPKSKQGSCEMSFDVTIEDGKLKKDEL